MSVDARKALIYSKNFEARMKTRLRNHGEGAGSNKRLRRVYDSRGRGGSKKMAKNRSRNCWMIPCNRQSGVKKNNVYLLLFHLCSRWRLSTSQITSHAWPPTCGDHVIGEWPPRGLLPKPTWRCAPKDCDTRSVCARRLGSVPTTGITP